jgi:lysyl-tRNA synthetase class 2
MPEMINETCELIRCLSQHGKLQLPAHKTVSYADAFQQACGLNPLTATLDEVRSTTQNCLKDILDVQLLQNIGNDRAGLLDLLACHIVNPSLGNDVLQVITDYPAEQALLARLHPDNEAIAERFEVFLNGIELANGYCELRDASVQARRFKTDNERRQALGLSHVAADDALLAALESGLPKCAGVAVGLDRLQMLANGHHTIAATLSFLPGT